MRTDSKIDQRLNRLKRDLGVLTDEELFSQLVVLAEALVKHAGSSSVITLRNVSGVDIKINIRGSV